MSVSSLTAAVDGYQCLYCEQFDHNKHDDANNKNSNASQSYVGNDIYYNTRIVLLLLLLMLNKCFIYRDQNTQKVK